MDLENPGPMGLENCSASLGKQGHGRQGRGPGPYFQGPRCPRCILACRSGVEGNSFSVGCSHTENYIRLYSIYPGRSSTLARDDTLDRPGCKHVRWRSRLRQNSRCLDVFKYFQILPDYFFGIVD